MNYVPPADSDPAEIVPYLWRDIHGGTLAFEVGANQGQSLPRMTDMFDRVIAFEPYEPSYELARQVEGADVRLMAVSDHDGEVTLTLVEHQFRSPGHECADRYDFSQLPNITVPCVSLDTLMAEAGVPDFVNMDVEGHELDILHGAVKLLAKGQASWLIEFHSVPQHEGCLEILSAACRRVETVRHPHYPPHTPNYFNHGWLLAHPEA